MTRTINFDWIADAGVPGGDWGNQKNTPQSPRAAITMPDKSIKITGGADAKIYTSHDLGTSWDAGYLIAAGATIRGLLRTRDGILLASDFTTGNIFRSVDGGKNWNTISTVGVAAAGDLVELADGGILVITGGSGKIFRSDDVGETWLEWSSNSYQLRRMIRTLDNTLIATSLASARVYRSFDLGKTWQPGILVDGLETAGFFGICQIPRGSIYVCAFGSSGKIYQSDDDGEHWFNCGKLTGFTGLGPIFDGFEDRIYCVSSTGKILRSRYTYLLSTPFPTYRNGHIGELLGGNIYDAMTGELLDRLPDRSSQSWGPFACYTIGPGETWYITQDSVGNYHIKNSKSGRTWDYIPNSSLLYEDAAIWMDDTGFYIQRKFFQTSPTRVDLYKVFYSDFSMVLIGTIEHYLSNFYSDNNGYFKAQSQNGTIIKYFSAPGKNPNAYSHYFSEWQGWEHSPHFYDSYWDNGIRGYGMMFSRGATFNADTGIMSDETFFGRPCKIMGVAGEIFDMATARYSIYGTPREQLVIKEGIINEQGLPILLIYDPNATSGAYSIYAPKIRNNIQGFGYMLELFLQQKTQNNLINFHRPVSTLRKFKS
jgi:photosystem II stability/assembly factor-like uncharacterized protein